VLPREHGAYGQLLFPLATALAVGHPSAAACALAAAAIFAFLTHEPLLVLIGQRGSRAAREDRARAWRWLLPLAAGFILSSALAVMWISDAARSLLAVPVVLALSMVLMIVGGQERTTAGELLSALTLSSVSLPIAAASGAPRLVALTVGSVFASASAAATVCVRAVIVYGRRPPAVAWRNAGAAVSIAAVVLLSGLAAQSVINPIAPWAALPVCAGGCVLVSVPPSPARLRMVGWTLVGTMLTSAVVLTAALR
jgi:hypothetical protein